MQDQRYIQGLLFGLILIALIFLPACSTHYEGEDFTFTAPAGFKTELRATPVINPDNDPEVLIFSQKGHLYFKVVRRNIPSGSNLNTVFDAYKSEIVARNSNYQFISQNAISLNNHAGTEYIYREFRGEPYVQIREIWVEYDGWIYSLFCSDPADATPGLNVPVSSECIYLTESFQFK